MGEAHTKGERLCPRKVRSTANIRSSLIFSSWKTTLNHLAAILEHNGLAYVRIDGDNELEERRVAIERFKLDPDIRVMILTLGTGAVG
jgi:SWI/SNF-related matrix-associated actin-dependent regulator of chromatin subfamily A3